MSDRVITTTQSYDTDAATWHAEHRDEDRANSRADSYRRFASLVRPHGLVLDLGCGSGLDIPALDRWGFRLVGLDRSEGLLRIAQTFPTIAGRLLLGDMRILPLADRAVDGVWADGSVHHLPKSDLGGAMRESARILRPGGVFFVSVERGACEGFVENREGVVGRRWYAHYQPEELRNFVPATEFTVIDHIVGGPGPHSKGFVALFVRRR